ncbi:MAG TPA: hypothetical protein PLA52_01830, partial [Candidatus Omnitrophota bacterium]|nr:hypothetical protein [Candidatus Omnitrophota bacterium]HRZ67439.1 hypothetical protein [Candidatus Omnitrophota bacterium]
MKKINPLYIAVAAAAAIIIAFVYNVAVNYLEERALNKAVENGLSASEVASKDLVGRVKHFYVEKRYWVKDDFRFDDFRRKLESSLGKSGFAIREESRAVKRMSAKGVEQSKEEVSYLITEKNSVVPLLRLTLIHKLPAAAAVKPPIAPTPAPAPPKAARPRIAIVLDDWGYNTKNVDAVAAIDAPLTLSVLPALPYSTS